MTASLRLLRLEIRRNLGPWVFLPLTALTIWVAFGFLNSSIWLWTETSFAIRNSVILTAPIIAALAAWSAGRDRRRRLDELLSSTPRPYYSRTLAHWFAPAAWGVLIFAVAAAILIGVTAWGATWGSLHVWPAVSGLSALLAYSAIGFAAGTWFPWRLTAPITGAALFVLQALPTYSRSNLEHLSPIAYESAVPDVFYASPSDFHFAQIDWFLGLGLTALVIAITRHRARPVLYGVLLVSTMLTVGAAVNLIQTDSFYQRGAAIPYTALCDESAAIPVCVHPAYTPMLDETSEVVERVTAPIIGLPGAPTRAEQRSSFDVANTDSVDPLIFDLRGIAHDAMYYSAAGNNQFGDDLVRTLLDVDHRAYPPGRTPASRRPKEVVGNWLLIQADVPLRVQVNQFGERLHGFLLNEEQEAALEQFIALDDAQRRAWLEENWSALREGQLTLEDLP